MKLRQICSATLLGLATLTTTLATTATPAMAAEAASHPTVSPNRYLEMLSRDNAVLLLVDHQVGLLSGVRDTTVGELKHNVVALANAARALGVPVIVTATMPDGMWGPTMPELTSALPDVKVINRTVINAWDDRKQLIIAGVSLEICASFPALSAKAAGYDARVVLDASGTFNEAKRTTGLQRLLGAGIPVTDYASAAVEMLRSNVDPKAHDVYSALDMPFATLVWQMQEGAKKS